MCACFHVCFYLIFSISTDHPNTSSQQLDSHRVVKHPSFHQTRTTSTTFSLSNFGLLHWRLVLKDVRKTVLEVMKIGSCTLFLSMDFLYLLLWFFSSYKCFCWCPSVELVFLYAGHDAISRGNEGAQYRSVLDTSRQRDSLKKSRRVLQRETTHVSWTTPVETTY